jgi:hypothetical protein
VWAGFFLRKEREVFMAKVKEIRPEVVPNPFEEAAKMIELPELVNVRFLQNVHPHREGECAGLEPTIAEHYIKFGVVVPVFEYGGKLYTAAEKQAADEQRAREDASRATLAPVGK